MPLAGNFELILCTNVLAVARKLRDLVTGGLDLSNGTGSEWCRRPNVQTPRYVFSIVVLGSPLGMRGSWTDSIILSKPFCMKDLIRVIEDAHTVAASFPDLR